MSRAAPRGMAAVALVLATLCGVLSGVVALTYTAPDGVVTTIPHCGMAYIGPQRFNISAGTPLVMADPLNACSTGSLNDPGSLSGAVAVVNAIGCPPEQKLRAVQSAGAVAMVWVANSLTDETVGVTLFLWDGSARDDLRIPVVSAPTYALTKLGEAIGGTVEIQPVLRSNKYFTLFTSPLYTAVFRYILPGWNAVNVFGAGYKFSQFVRHQNGIQLTSLSQWTLVLEAIGSIMRCVWAPLTQFMPGTRYAAAFASSTAAGDETSETAAGEGGHHLNNLDGQVLMVISNPIELTATVMAGAFWRASADVSISRVSAIVRFRWAIAAASMFFFAISVVGSTMTGLWIGSGPEQALTITRLVVYVAMSLVTSTLFVTYGLRHLRTLAKVAEQQARHTTRAAPGMALGGGAADVGSAVGSNGPGDANAVGSAVAPSGAPSAPPVSRVPVNSGAPPAPVNSMIASGAALPALVLDDSDPLSAAPAGGASVVVSPAADAAASPNRASARVAPAPVAAAAPAPAKPMHLSVTVAPVGPPLSPAHHSALSPGGGSGRGAGAGAPVGGSTTGGSTGSDSMFDSAHANKWRSDLDRFRHLAIWMVIGGVFRFVSIIVFAAAAAQNFLYTRAGIGLFLMGGCASMSAVSSAQIIMLRAPAGRENAGQKDPTRFDKTNTKTGGGPAGGPLAGPLSPVGRSPGGGGPIQLAMRSSANGPPVGSTPQFGAVPQSGAVQVLVPQSPESQVGARVSAWAQSP